MKLNSFDWCPLCLDCFSLNAQCCCSLLCTYCMFLFLSPCSSFVFGLLQWNRGMFMNELVVFKKRKVNKRLKFISDFCGFVKFLGNAFMTTDCIEKMDSQAHILMFWTTRLVHNLMVSDKVTKAQSKHCFIVYLTLNWMIISKINPILCLIITETITWGYKWVFFLRKLRGSFSYVRLYNLIFLPTAGHQKWCRFKSLPLWPHLYTSSTLWFLEEFVEQQWDSTAYRFTYSLRSFFLRWPRRHRVP